MNNTDPNISRPYDVIVWGATGFTGQLVVDYLAERCNADEQFNWAIAGRSESKLDEMVQRLVHGVRAPGILLADSHDPASLQHLASSTRVVLTTVGPYALYGDELVAACVNAGTHYCDLAGEVQWMRRMIDRHAETAAKTGARIVHSCGFDSIPSDIGVQFLQEHSISKTGSPCAHVELLVKSMRGGGSGGTIASGLNSMDERHSDREVARLFADPYSLNPAGEHDGPDGRDQSSVRFNELANAWTAPFIMSVINTRIVRRSNALMKYPYGKDFRYNESVLMGKGGLGWLKSATYTAGLGAFLAASSFGPTRHMVIEKLLPKPGEGPSKEERENGFFNILLIGRTKDGEIFKARVTGDRDPGYGSTSKMISESAACLAKDELDVAGGFWTPASAMGRKLRDRLTTHAGLRFEILRA